MNFLVIFFEISKFLKISKFWFSSAYQICLFPYTICGMKSDEVRHAKAYQRKHFFVCIMTIKLKIIYSKQAHYYKLGEIILCHTFKKIFFQSTDRLAWFFALFSATGTVLLKRKKKNSEFLN